MCWQMILINNAFLTNFMNKVEFSGYLCTFLWLHRHKIDFPPESVEKEKTVALTPRTLVLGNYAGRVVTFKVFFERPFN